MTVICTVIMSVIVHGVSAGQPNRLLGPLEAMNGVLIIGVSTATLMASFQDSLKKPFLARQKNVDPDRLSH
ncbi:MAG: hypothetical protein ACWGOX_16280 [Desulforhopalus sp.]